MTLISMLVLMSTSLVEASEATIQSKLDQLTLQIANMRYVVYYYQILNNNSYKRDLKQDFDEDAIYKEFEEDESEDSWVENTEGSVKSIKLKPHKGDDLPESSQKTAIDDLEMGNLAQLSPNIDDTIGEKPVAPIPKQPSQVSHDPTTPQSITLKSEEPQVADSEQEDELTTKKVNFKKPTTGKVNFETTIGDIDIRNKTVEPLHSLEIEYQMHRVEQSHVEIPKKIINESLSEETIEKSIELPQIREINLNLVKEETVVLPVVKDATSSTEEVFKPIITPTIPDTQTPSATVPSEIVPINEKPEQKVINTSSEDEAVGSIKPEGSLILSDELHPAHHTNVEADSPAVQSSSSFHNRTFPGYPIKGEDNTKLYAIYAGTAVVGCGLVTLFMYL